ncbi:hypothetical protein DV495_000009 [Geotrichum candidum]|nr:hypothetical protein DV452_002876 [Geotrichum candidum]KAI9212972.1 hypothetical protein DS838_002172 [Geotrichum bryndzae]KAF5118874.1 hypothetical protein DV454_000238 [Geotrichum candidum]KAF5136143.1 hypothetical protein DV495_000009 [Geotrichum candidum]KAF7500927.1 hypothetical protein DV113_001029 [Geotrichum candidum]
MSSGDDATITTDKRGRGRPRKYPIGQSPSEKLKAARENGLQRGRGRPRKLPISDIDAPAQISLPPLQSPDEDDLDAILNDRSARGSATTTAATGEQKRGRGRPPKHKVNPEQEDQLARSAPKSKAAKASSRK